MPKTLVKMQFGSRVYGTSGSGSDTDFRAIHVPESADILLQRAKPTIIENSKLDPSAPNSPDDADFTSYSLQHYFALLLKGTPDCLTMLFTSDDRIVVAGPEWERLRQAKEHWLFRGLDSMTGFCRGKINEYGVFGGKRVATAKFVVDSFGSMIERHGAQKRLDEIWDEIEALLTDSNSEFMELVKASAGVGPTTLDVCDKKTQANSTLKEAHKTYKKLHDEYVRRVAQAESGRGIDWKELMHVVRVCHEAEELLLDHRITYPRPEAALLLSIRNGDLPVARVSDIIDDGILRIAECQRRSSLPTSPNYEAAEQFVAAVYRDQVCRS